MNTRIFLAMIGLLLFPLAATRADQSPPQISVSGSAEVKVAPDEVDLNVGVETRDESLEAAKQKNDESISGALAFLKQNGVKEKDVQTDYITIEPEYDPNARHDEGVDPRTGFPVPGKYKYHAPTKPDYYVVRKSVVIKITDVSSFDAILTGLVTNGVNSVQGIEFRTSALRKYKDQARAMAIKAAREKADAMATALGVKVGQPSYININDSGGSSSWSRGGWGYNISGFAGNAYQNASQDNIGSEENSTSFAAGQISILAQVNVSFLIQ